ncbi:MAG: L,D-transpeptidase family protein [Caulobacterales bacterium]
MPKLTWSACALALALISTPLGAAVAQGAPTSAPAPTPASAPPGAAAPLPLSLEDGHAIAGALARGPGEGIATPDISAALQALSSADGAARGQADAAVSSAAIAFAGAEHGLRIEPQSVDHDWALRAAYDPAAEFAAARAAGRIGAWAEGLARSDPSYRALVAARWRYGAIVANGGWGQVPVGPTLKPPAPEAKPPKPAAPDAKPPKPPVEDARVPALRARLTAEGYLMAPADASDVYDTALAAAVAAFQGRHALKADGVLTDATVQALNVPAEDRLAAIDANLERARWLPDPLPPQRIEVDISATEARLISPGAPDLAMRAIVGDLKHHTPTLVSKVVAIVFNPPWVVPSSIAAAELYPKERRHPGYFAANGFSVVNGQLIQAAGPKAALGLIKFEIPDPFSVYLHDTPSRSLFNREARWLSHGCVRVQRPRELAAALLAPQGWSRDDVDAAIAEDDTKRTPVTVQVPVFIIYRTAVADDQAQVTFRSDVYGWDAELEAALNRH